MISGLLLEDRNWESVFLYEMWITEVCYHSSLDGSITICMGSLTICSKGTGPPPAIKLDLFILGEIYEALSATNQMETKKPFFYPHSLSTRENIHSFLRWCSHCNLYYILINCWLCWEALQETANLILDELPQSFPCASQTQYFNRLATVCR